MLSDAAAIYNRVLFISPSDAGLDVTPEVDSLQELGFQVRVLQGEVVADRIFTAVRNGQFAIMHFACHARPDGVILSKGTLFDIDSILQVARMAGARLVFLNGCSTAVIGQVLVDEGVPVAIVAMREIRDDLMKQTAQAFYKHLAATGNPHEAYSESKPASRGMYLWLADGGYQDLMIEPVLKRLDAFEEVISANNRDHAEFRSITSRLSAVAEDISRQKQWFLLVSVGTVVLMAAIQTVLLLVSRGVMP